MKIESVELHQLSLNYKYPFETSFGRETRRELILVAVRSGGNVGWGECVAGSGPWYSYETVGTAWHIMESYLIPTLLGAHIETPAAVVARFSRIRGHAMARACLENAIWDLLARVQGVSLAAMLGGVREHVAVGVSLGIEATLNELLTRVEMHVDEGYSRVKLKIKPGWDVDVVRTVRERWPDLRLQVDANSAYKLSDVGIFRELDEFDLLLIEQPLHYDDMVDHAKLQEQLNTPICLDESIRSPEHARWALEVDACRIINVKVGRVGGLTAARNIHDLCAQRGVPVWCGGMLETNVGRAVNVALSSLPNFTLPADISASARYFQKDVATPDFVLNSDSTLNVPSGPGHGITVDMDHLVESRSEMRVFSA